MTSFVFQQSTTGWNSVEKDGDFSKIPRKSSSRPNSFRGEFSFVNKDARTIDDKSHTVAVTWHVMNRYERWKKQQAANVLRQSASVLDSGFHLPTASYRHQESPRLSARDSASPRSPTRQLAGMPQTTVRRNLPDTVRPLLPDTSKEESSSSSADTMPTFAQPTLETDWSILKDCSSVLNTSPTNMHVAGGLIGSPSLGDISERLIKELTSFAYEYVIPQTWPRETAGIQNCYEVTRSWDDAVAALQDECYANAFFAFLAVVAGSTRKAGLHHQAHLFQTRASTELRQRIGRGGPQELLTLKAILKLFSSETVVENALAARGHLKMLKNLVEAQGGIILLDSWFREDLLACDCYFALKHGTRPFFPAQEWSPGPLSLPWKARLVAARVSNDAVGSIDPTIEHSTLRSIFADLRELFKIEAYVINHNLPSEDHLLRWRQVRRLDCVSRLADHRVNLAIYPHLYDKPKTQLLVTIATSLLANMVLGSPEPVRFGLKLLGELQQAFMDNQHEVKDEKYSRLQLWTLYIGSLAERVHPVDICDKTWFMSRLSKLAVELKIDTWNEMKDTLRQFLFCESLHQEISINRAYRTQDVLRGVYSICGTSWRLPFIHRHQSGGVGEREHVMW